MKITVEMEYIDLLRLGDLLEDKVVGLIADRDESIFLGCKQNTIDGWNQSLANYKETQDRVEREINKQKRAE